MDWRKKFDAKQMTAEEAAQRITSGMWVTTGLIEAYDILSTLACRSDLENVTIFVGESVFGGIKPFLTEENSKRFRIITAFISPFTQQALEDGKLEFMPSFFSTATKMFQEGYLQCDVALVHVTPPDEFGWCSLSLSVDYIKGALRNIPHIIAEVNPLLPRTCGDTLLHVDSFDCWVPTSTPPPVVPLPPEKPEYKVIASYLNELVEDGATIEAGTGSVVNYAVSKLERKNLGIHSEMFLDGLMVLMKRGVATNNQKSLFRNRSIATMAFGSEDLYQFVNCNPGVELHPAETALNPQIIAQNNRMTAINTAFQIDLLGQVNAETLGRKQISGVGGQTDFMRGAAMCPGGKSILVLPSAARGGTISSIVAQLPQGTPVTSTRNDVHYVITEHGVAKMIGRSTRQRALDLISIAGESFRDELTSLAKQMNLI